jgi:DNA repair protein RecN (Recombination protein N)
MLTALSIRDVVLIERLDLHFGPGLTVLTGETGAGKSILLDSLGLALGARAEQGLVRAGAPQAVASAAFSLPPAHPGLDLLAEHGLQPEPEVVLRRMVGRDGRSRAFINDSPVGAALLRRLGAMLVEVQGQHDQMGLADSAGHTALLDGFGVAPALRQAAAAGFAAWRQARAAEAQAEATLEAARRDQEFLRHATAELQTLAPEPGEEDRLAAERQHLQSAERRGETIAAALAELAPASGRNRSAGPAAAVRAAARALQRLPAGEAEQDAAAALERAQDALDEAETALTRLAETTAPDPRRLEQAEERLFALRGMARKHNVPVAGLPELLESLRARLAALETGEAALARHRATTVAARASYVAACAALSGARAEAAVRLDAAVMHELPPLKLERAVFVTELLPRAEAEWGADGVEQARFLIAANPGQAPGPLGRVASGGELSRLMLALKVALSGTATAGTLVFDEVDSGIGGATAAAVGERLARLAGSVQVLLVTHSPQVAARGTAHLLVAKRVGDGDAQTSVVSLARRERREEIARMLAGARITDAARSAADSLLRGHAA